MGVSHFETAPSHSWELGHLRGRWTLLGEAAGSRGIGVRRIELPSGGFSTPAHEHGRSEEIFYVLAGAGSLWSDGLTSPLSAGDAVLCAPRRGAHTICGGEEGIDLLAFGTREHDESPAFPRLERQLVGDLLVGGDPGVIDRAPGQFVLEAAAGPPALDRPRDGQPRWHVALATVEPVAVRREAIARTARNLGVALGAARAGLQHVEVEPGAEATDPHCHSVDEELFVILAGAGTLILGDEETPIQAGHVVSRPPASLVPHLLRAGPAGLTYLAYGTRDPADICFYPRRGEIAIRGLGITARLDSITFAGDGTETL